MYIKDGNKKFEMQKKIKIEVFSCFKIQNCNNVSEFQHKILKDKKLK